MSRTVRATLKWERGRQGGKKMEYTVRERNLRYQAKKWKESKGEENWFTIVVCLPLFLLFDCLTHTHTQTCEVVKLQLAQLLVWTSTLDWGPFIDWPVCQTWRTRGARTPPRPQPRLLPPHWHALHTKTHTHTPSPSPLLPPSRPFPKLLLRKNGSESERRRQADGTHRVTQRRGHHTPGSHTNTHTVRTGVIDSHTLKRHGARFLGLQASGDSSSHPGTVIFTFFHLSFHPGKKIFLFGDSHLSPYNKWCIQKVCVFIDYCLKVCVHLQFVFYEYVILCSRNALFRCWRPFNSSLNRAVSVTWRVLSAAAAESPCILCVSVQSHNSRLVMQVSKPFYLGFGLPVTIRWLPCLRHDGEYSAVQRGADDKGFSRCANIVCLADWKGHRMYIDTVCKKGTGVGFLSPFEEFSIFKENVLSLSCWQVT